MYRTDRWLEAAIRHQRVNTILCQFEGLDENQSNALKNERNSFTDSPCTLLD